MNESIKHNFTQFFLSFLVLSMCIINEKYFSFVIGNKSMRPSMCNDNFFDDEMHIVTK